MKSIFKSTIIMTIGTILVKTISMFFRVFISGRLGAQGMGLYQLIFSVYLMVVTIAYSGINTAVMRIVGEGKRHPDSVIKGALSIGVPLGISSAVGLYFFADKIGFSLLKNADTVLALKMLAPSVPFMCVSASIIAYFVGSGKLVRPLLVQMNEQLVRVVVIYLIMDKMLNRGIKYGLCATTLCMTLGEIVSCTILSILYLLDKKPKTRKINNGAKREILSVCVPVAGINYLAAGLATAENILLPIKLAMYDSVGAIATYGMLNGMALPMIMFPSSLLTSLATILMPNIAKNVADRDYKMMRDTLNKVFKFTTCASTVIVAVFLTFPYQLGMAVYKNSSVGTLVTVLCTICPIIYLETVVTSVLTGLSEQKYTLKVNLIEAVFTLAIILVFVEKFGFKAYLFAVMCGTLMSGTLKFVKVLKVTRITIDLSNTVLIPVLAALTAACTSRLISGAILWKRYSLTSGLIIGIAILVSVYFLLLMFTGTIKNDRMLKNKRIG